MSVLDVMNYVRSTPRNTNPAVIASMVENEQRSAVHEEVTSLQEAGAIGAKESRLLLDLIVFPEFIDESGQFGSEALIAEDWLNKNEFRFFNSIHNWLFNFMDWILYVSKNKF